VLENRLELVANILRAGQRSQCEMEPLVRVHEFRQVRIGFILDLDCRG
jgi:hypothetical protein